MKYQILDKNRKEEVKTIIYNLKKQGFKYTNIVKELQKQGIEICKDTVVVICKELYVEKEEKQPELKGKEKRIQEKNVYVLIYNLREQGLTYKDIVQELKKHGINTCISTVRKKCKEMYYVKGEKEPQREKRDEINQKIYELREQGFSYTDIFRKLEEQGIKLVYSEINRRCKEIYSLKGTKDPNSIEERKEKIYRLRKQGLTYQRIAEEVGMSATAVSKLCKKIYDSKEEKIPKAKRRKNSKTSAKAQALDEKIYDLREQGLKYKQISDKVKEDGVILTRQRIQQRHKNFLKENEEQLAKAILNLLITRKATMKQIQQIADYYGVDLEKTLDSLEER